MLKSQKSRPQGQCEVITISGATGLGKSYLVQSVQVEARRRGYFARSKFDQAKKTPFDRFSRIVELVQAGVF